MNDENFAKVKLEVEALLFSYGDWLSLHDMSQTLELDSELILKTILEELKEKFKEGFSFHVEENDSGKFRMTLKDDHAELVSELISGMEIPPKVLKVLSVIAYEQPVTKTRLAEILGKSVKTEVSFLYRNKFLSYEKKGIGKYYKVTKKFYDYFKMDEGEFKTHADKNIKTFLEEPSLVENETSENEEKETNLENENGESEGGTNSKENIQDIDKINKE